jgi:hypothetical protein
MACRLENSDGSCGEQVAAEFRTMKAGRLIEWRAFAHTLAGAEGPIDVYANR